MTRCRSYLPKLAFGYNVFAPVHMTAFNGKAVAQPRLDCGCGGLLVLACHLNGSTLLT